MQFKIGNTSVKISFSFTALLLLLFISDNALVLITLIGATLHEIVHVIFILLFSGKISSVNLSIIGADIKRCTLLIKSNIKEAIISVSAPLFNIILFIVFYNSSGILKSFSDINLSLGFFNLLPFYSFDGGCFVRYILSEKFDEEKAEKITEIVSLITVSILTVLSVILCVTNKKIHSILLICLFMVLSLVFKK